MRSPTPHSVRVCGFSGALLGFCRGRHLWLVPYLLGSAYLLAQSSQFPRFAWLTCVGLLPLFLAIRSYSPRLVFWLGFLWGGGYYLMLTLSGAPSFEGSWPALALMTLLPAVFGCLARMAIARLGCSTVILALAWLMVELSLQSAGVRFGLLGNTHLNSPLLSAIGSFGGYAFAVFVVAFLSASLSCILSSARFRLPRLRPYAPLPDLIPYPVSLISFCLHFLILNHQVNPRAPPVGLLR